MRVIINESQYKLINEAMNKSAMIELIKDNGLHIVADESGLSPLKLLKKIDYDISEIRPFDLFPVLVDMQKEYKGCDIEVDWFSDNSYGVYWVVYKELIGNYVIGCVTMALPEFNEGKVYVENAHCWVDNNLTTSDFNNFINYNVKTIDFDIPTKFESWDDMVKWYKTEYMPNTYEIIERQAFEIIKQLKKKNEI
jgi:hypothetical protein